MLLAFGIPSVLLGIFFAIVAKRADYALLVPLGLMAIMLGIFFLVALVIDLFGGFKVTFLLTSQGVRSVAGKGAKAASTAAVLAGILSGKSGVLGAGLLAESEQNVFISWKDVTQVKVWAARRYILIKREWGYKPIGLYGTPENFTQIMAIIQQHAGDKIPR